MNCHLQVVTHHTSFVFDLRNPAAPCVKKITATSQLLDPQKYIESGYLLGSSIGEGRLALITTNATKDFYLQSEGSTTIFRTFSRIGLFEATQLSAHVRMEDRPG